MNFRDAFLTLLTVRASRVVGTARASTTPMIAMTIISSTSVNPRLFTIPVIDVFINVLTARFTVGAQGRYIKIAVAAGADINKIILPGIFGHFPFFQVASLAPV